mmetsp:Transcript_68340/g.134327  ORF Transcript_68340/g.134327 Transcript_68340/m.134327 type:complete len:204 (+) Transcript_68340:81-692(+)
MWRIAVAAFCALQVGASAESYVPGLSEECFELIKKSAGEEKGKEIDADCKNKTKVFGSDSLEAGLQVGAKERRLGFNIEMPTDMADMLDNMQKAAFRMCLTAGWAKVAAHMDKEHTTNLAKCMQRKGGADLDDKSIGDLPAVQRSELAPMAPARGVSAAMPTLGLSLAALGAVGFAACRKNREVAAQAHLSLEEAHLAESYEA